LSHIGFVVSLFLFLSVGDGFCSDVLSENVEKTGGDKMGSVRESVIAGSWYPGDSEELSKVIDGYLNDVQVGATGDIYALISPHAGYRYSGRAAAYAYKTLQNQTITTVIILAPGHHTAFRGASILDVEYYETPLGKVKLDSDICAKLLKSDLFSTNRSAHRNEHSIEIQLPFLQSVLGEFSIVPILIGHLEESDYTGIAESIKNCIDAETVVVVSSDFTHYGLNFGYLPFRSDIKSNIAKLDGGAIDKIINKDKIGFSDYLSKTGATICGREPIKILLEILPQNVSGRELIYYTSGDLTGDYSSCVSYASIIFKLDGASK